MPGAPDFKQKKHTSAEVAAATQQNEKLQLELEQIEKDKIWVLAEMEAVEEEENDEERTGIKDIADLVESHVDSETDIQCGKEGIARDIDIVMADKEDNEVDDAFVEVDSEPELEGLEMVKKVSDSG